MRLAFFWLSTRILFQNAFYGAPRPNMGHILDYSDLFQTYPFSKLGRAGNHIAFSWQKRAGTASKLSWNFSALCGIKG
jgi:hypothetical protein